MKNQENTDFPFRITATGKKIDLEWVYDNFMAKMDAEGARELGELLIKKADRIDGII